MEINYTKILVAYDQSPASHAALISALSAARAFGASLDICYVVTDARTSRVNEVTSAVDDIKAKNKDISINFMVRDGKIFKEIVHLEKEVSSSLIIMGHFGAPGGIQSMFMGSNAFKVVSSSKCPVITVRENATKSTISKIFMPFSDSEQTRQKVPFVAQFAKGFKAEVVICPVSTSHTDETKRRLAVYVAQAETYFDKQKVKYTVGEGRFEGNIADNCIELAKKYNCDIISMMTETESAGIFMGAYPHQLINKSPLPVFSIHSRSLNSGGSVGY